MIRFTIEIGSQTSERDFDADRVSVGRDTVNDLVLDHPSVAAHHCRVERTDQDWRLVGGEGETLLNGEAVRERRLYHRDRIDLGEVTLTFINEAEAAALKPDEPIVVPDERPADILPDTLTIKPPAAESEAAQSIPVAASPEAGPTKTCPYCGHDIPEKATICRYCEEPLDRHARRRHREPAGNWSLLSARASATRGVSFRQMVEWVGDGTVNDNSSVSGPTTGFQWRFASETPRLSKYLGVCYQCGAPVKPTDEICAACRIDLDGPSDHELQRTEVTAKRKGRLLRIAAAVSFVLAALMGVGYLVAFTRVGRWILSQSAQQRVQETVEGPLMRAEERPAPEQFPVERGRMREAEVLCLRDDFDGALRIYADLQRRLAHTPLAGEIDAAIAFTRRCQKAHGELAMGDALMAAGNPQAALKHYLVVAEQFDGTPAAEGIDQKIAAARAAAQATGT